MNELADDLGGTGCQNAHQTGVKQIAGDGVVILDLTGGHGIVAKGGEQLLQRGVRGGSGGIKIGAAQRVEQTVGGVGHVVGLDQTAVEGVTDQAENGGIGTVHENTSEKKSKFHTEI